MSGTFVPMYGLNNMFGQIPIVGLFLGGGSNEGLIGVTYEVVGTPGQPVLRVNPISAMAPGVLRKIFEFNTGKQNNQIEFRRITDRRIASSSRSAGTTRNGIMPEHHGDQRERDQRIVAVGPVVDQAAAPGAERRTSPLPIEIVP